MSTKDFDRIDIVTSTVAHHIFHASLPEHVKLLASVKLAEYVGFIQNDQTQNVPTIITRVYELAEAKRSMRKALEPDILRHPVYHRAIKAMESVGKVDAQNFKDVVSSKLFELMLAHHSGIVTEKVIEEAEKSDDGKMPVGVAFALERDDEQA